MTAAAVGNVRITSADGNALSDSRSERVRVNRNRGVFDVLSRVFHVVSFALSQKPGFNRDCRVRCFVPLARLSSIFRFCPKLLISLCDGLLR